MNTQELTSEIQFNSSYSESIKINKRVSTVSLIVISSFLIGSLPLFPTFVLRENSTLNQETPIVTSIWQVLGKKL